MTYTLSYSEVNFEGIEDVSSFCHDLVGEASWKVHLEVVIVLDLWEEAEGGLFKDETS